jgi:hypothetical protein
MRNWAKWKAGAARRSAAGKAGAEARWAREHAELEGEPLRRTRVVEIEIRDSLLPMRTIRLEAEPREQGWSRWLVMENGRRCGKRRFGAKRVAVAIAESLC